MSNIYDDPRVTAGEGRVRFEEIGDRAKGRITRAAVYTGMGNGYRYELADAMVRQGGQQGRWPIADVICTPGQLVEQLKRQQPQMGDTVDIELTDLRTSPAGTAKLFRVETQKALQPAGYAPAPAQPYPQAPANDPWAQVPETPTPAAAPAPMQPNSQAPADDPWA